MWRNKHSFISLMNIFFKCIILPFFIVLFYSFNLFPTDKSSKRLHKNTSEDSLLMIQYRQKIIMEIFELDSLITEEEKQIYLEQTNFNLQDGLVKYAPDSTFKIFVYEGEDCGASCNNFYYSFIHYVYSGKEIALPADFTDIDTIYKLEKNKYLILQSSSEHPVGPVYNYCKSADLVSFTADSVYYHPIFYKGNSALKFCQQESAITESQPFLTYNTKQKLLDYSYATNYAYQLDLDIDTIRTGSFKYVKGQFILQKEDIKATARK
jgi:hypothetical protein